MLGTLADVMRIRIRMDLSRGCGWVWFEYEPCKLCVTLVIDGYRLDRDELWYGLKIELGLGIDVHNSGVYRRNE